MRNYEKYADEIREIKEDYEEPEVDWIKVEVDTPILVRDSEDEKCEKGYFALKVRKSDGSKRICNEKGIR